MIAVDELKKHVGVSKACRALEVPRASYYRFGQPSVRTPTKSKRTHRRALSDSEKVEVKTTLYGERFVDKSPYQVYAMLVDEGRYLCSVRTMYRVLAEDNASRERRNQLRHPNYVKPELLATGPNQVWSWDITKLLGPQKWTYYYLYVILDIYSRYVVGWMLAHREAQDLATRLIRETIDKQDVREDELTLHSDRGPSMTSHNVAQLLATLGVTKSHSRPHVSNDNPFSESQFKTLKYRPEFPARFESHDEALRFCRTFFAWYNEEHYHSGIGLLTPASLHYDQADKILAARHEVLCSAYAEHPERFVNGRPKAQQTPEAVWINPPLAPTPETKSGLPETHCPQKPEASLTHPRLGYPSASCVPAELDSVSPSNPNTNDFNAEQQPFEHSSHASKNPGGLGAGPHPRKKASAARSILTN
jgi:putative transposase